MVLLVALTPGRLGGRGGPEAQHRVGLQPLKGDEMKMTKKGEIFRSTPQQKHIKTTCNMVVVGKHSVMCNEQIWWM